MILLDTNVISEPLKAFGEPKVLAWLDTQAIETLYLSTINLAELRFGIANAPPGKNRDRLQERFERRVLPLFTGRVLVFDEAAAQAYALLRSRARARGQTIAPADGYIAAVALSHGFTVATHDTTLFEAAGLTVIDPWEAVG